MQVARPQRFGNRLDHRVAHAPYHGTADAKPVYLITVHAAWRATGDRGLLERHLETAEGCLAWIEEYGDLDGDGFQDSPSEIREPASQRPVAGNSRTHQWSECRKVICAMSAT